MDIRLNNLNKTIINCRKCPRLVKFIHKVSTNKRKQNINEIYWGKPVPGFGDSDSKWQLLVLHPLLMVAQEQEEPLPEINQGIFYLNVYTRLEFRILHNQRI